MQLQGHARVDVESVPETWTKSVEGEMVEHRRDVGRVHEALAVVAPLARRRRPPPMPQHVHIFGDGSVHFGSQVGELEDVDRRDGGEVVGVLVLLTNRLQHRWPVGILEGDDRLVDVGDQDVSMRADVPVEAVVVGNQFVPSLLLAIPPDKVASDERLIRRLTRKRQRYLKFRVSAYFRAFI